jgi:predicted NUDIX family NTP pyrophosphohydrolase
MPAKKSAGLLLYRSRNSELQVFLVHPGGPFWVKKDDGAWSIPKGEFGEGEDALETAKRELFEETGCRADGKFLPLTPVRQAGGKLVYAWAAQGDCDADAIRSNLFSLEWPPRSGKRREFPEVDRAAWFTLQAARRKILKSQLPILTEFESKRD